MRKVRPPRTRVWKPKEIIPSEHDEQVMFVQWFRSKYPTVLIMAIPNGGYRSKVTASRIKAEGGVSGIPDLFIPEWNLWIEMKRSKGGKLSENQKAIISELNRIGYDVIVANGCAEAINDVRKFINPGVKSNGA